MYWNLGFFFMLLLGPKLNVFGEFDNLIFLKF